MNLDYEEDKILNKHALLSKVTGVSLAALLALYANKAEDNTMRTLGLVGAFVGFLLVVSRPTVVDLYLKRMEDEEDDFQDLESMDGVN